MTAFSIFLVLTVITWTFSIVAPGVWQTLLTFLGVAFSALSICAAWDYIATTHARHVRELNLARTGAYQRLADSIRGLPIAGIEFISHQIAIQRVRTVSFDDLHQEHFLMDMFRMPSGEEMEQEFIRDYLCACKWRMTHVAGSELWPQNHHTKKDIAPVATWLGGWEKLEDRILEVQSALVFWDFAFKTVGMPLRLKSPLTCDDVAATLRIPELDNV